VHLDSQSVFLPVQFLHKNTLFDLYKILVLFTWQNLLHIIAKPCISCKLWFTVRLSVFVVSSLPFSGGGSAKIPVHKKKVKPPGLCLAFSVLRLGGLQMLWVLPAALPAFRCLCWLASAWGSRARAKNIVRVLWPTLPRLSWGRLLVLV